MRFGSKLRALQNTLLDGTDKPLKYTFKVHDMLFQYKLSAISRQYLNRRQFTCKMRVDFHNFASVVCSLAEDTVHLKTAFLAFNYLRCNKTTYNSGRSFMRWNIIALALGRLILGAFLVRSWRWRRIVERLTGRLVPRVQNPFAGGGRIERGGQMMLG